MRCGVIGCDKESTCIIYFAGEPYNELHVCDECKEELACEDDLVLRGDTNGRTIKEQS